MITLFLVESVFCISTGCWVMLENGTSMENLMVWSSWITMLETILKLGFRFPPAVKSDSGGIVVCNDDNVDTLTESGAQV